MKTYKEYLNEAGNVHLAYFLEAADITGVKYEVITKSLMAKFSYNDKHWFIINTVTPLTNTPSTTIAKRKNLTNHILSLAEIPVPKQMKLKTEEDAISFFRGFKNIVIKPVQQLGGHGITLLPQDEEQVKEAFKNAYTSNQGEGETKVLGEEFLNGENYRFLVLDKEVIGIVRRKHPYITGNSKNTIGELIQITNEDRKMNMLKPITIDNELHLRLKLSGKTLETIPNLSEEVILRYNCNLTTGGTTEECANEVHPYYKELAIKAVKEIGAKYGGVDIIAEDITKPGKCGINEINYNPGLRLHYKVNKGNIVKVAVPIIEYLKLNAI